MQYGEEYEDFNDRTDCGAIQGRVYLSGSADSELMESGSNNMHGSQETTEMSTLERI